MFGYMGKILRINLTTSTITEEFPDEETALKCLFLAGASGPSVTETLLAFPREKTLAIMKELP